MTVPKIVISWSGGKDSALALYEIQKSGGYEIEDLLTTIIKEYQEVRGHGVCENLLERQAKALGFHLKKMLFSKGETNKDYETELLTILRRYRNSGVLGMVFGDIFLEDIKKFRETILAKVGMYGIYPLWGRNTTKLAKLFIDSGFKAIVSVIDSNVLDREFLAAEYDGKFLKELPEGVDPCGENGEFHTFVYDGPLFKNPIAFTKGEFVFRENRFWFCDLIPTK